MTLQKRACLFLILSHTSQQKFFLSYYHVLAWSQLTIKINVEIEICKNIVKIYLSFILQIWSPVLDQFRVHERSSVAYCGIEELLYQCFFHYIIDRLSQKMPYELMQQCEKFQSEVAFFPCFPVFTRHSYKDNVVCIKQVCKNDNCPVKEDQKKQNWC